MTMDALNQFDDAYPLTPLQHGMLFHVLSEPDGNDYVGLVTALIEGPLTAEAAHNAWETILARHEALRTAFIWEGLDQPMQVVHKSAALDFQWITDADWRARSNTS